jgi:hypothetical protein
MIVKILKKYVDPDLADSFVDIFLFFVLVILCVYFDPLNFM